MNSGNSQQPLMVSIKCLVYNHAPYLRQCLEGFVMQKTNFRFEAIVHDDASTDGSAEIIREYAEKYPEIIKPIYETENQYSKRNGAVLRIMNAACKGKYIATCEGDDYWIDPFKLQKQVDFLEQNPDFVLVHTAYKTYNEKTKQEGTFEHIEKLNEKINNKYTPLDILKTGGLILTLTVMVRRKEMLEVFSEDEFVFSPYFLMKDTQMWYLISKKGKIQYFPEETAVYRISEGSACRPVSLKKRIRFLLSTLEMRLYLCKKDKLDEAYTNIIINEYNKALLKYLSLDKNFKPLYSLDLSRINRITRFLYTIRIYSVLIKLWEKYDTVKSRIHGCYF